MKKPKSYLIMVKLHCPKNLIQKLKNKPPRIIATNRGYSVEYWDRHLHYAILGEPKLEEDNSNVEWTKKTFNGLISGNVTMIFGLSGINGVIAIMEFIKVNFGNEYEIAIKILKEYAHTQNNQVQIDFANSL